MRACESAEMLVESPRPVARQEGPLLTSAHGSGNYSSDLRSMVLGLQEHICHGEISAWLQYCRLV
jgi:hypothetical protein